MRGQREHCPDCGAVLDRTRLVDHQSRCPNRNNRAIRERAVILIDGHDIQYWRRAAAEAETTVQSLARMLGWMNTPPRHILENSIRGLKDRLIAALHEINDAWFGIEHGWDIESRKELEKQAETNGFRYGLAMAVYQIWKREPKPKFPMPGEACPTCGQDDQSDVIGCNVAPAYERLQPLDPRD